VPDGRSLPEAWRAIDRLEQAAEQHVRRDVYAAERDADRARIKRLEDDDTNKASGNRNWMLGLAQTAIGAVLAFIAAYLMAKGHG
jgi:hypothetical protein